MCECGVTCGVIFVVSVCGVTSVVLSVVLCVLRGVSHPAVCLTGGEATSQFRRLLVPALTSKSPFTNHYLVFNLKSYNDYLFTQLYVN